MSNDKNIVGYVAAIFAILFNIFAIVIVIKNRSFKPIDVFLLNIFCVGLTYAVLECTHENITETHESTAAILIEWMTVLFVHIQCTLTFSLALQRSVLLNIPLKARTYISTKLTTIQIIIIYIFYLIVFVCSASIEALNGFTRHFTLIVGHIFNWLLLIEGGLMVAMYTQLLYRIRNNHRFQRSMRRRRHYKAFFVSIAIAISFIVSYFPITIIRIRSRSMTESVVHLMVWIDCIMNPVFYLMTESPIARRWQQNRVSHIDVISKRLQTISNVKRNV